MNRHSPIIARALLRFVRSRSEHESLIGDLEELYNFRLSENGIVFAWFWYWFQVLRSMPSLMLNSIKWSIIMFKNYFKIALRNIKRQKTYSFINITGLAVGLACSLIIFTWVRAELSFDSFHENRDSIYRIVANWDKYDWNSLPITPAPLGDAIVKDIPEITKAVRFGSMPRSVVRYAGNSFYEDEIVITDPALFDVFTFDFLKGDHNSAFSDASNIVITESIAEKYFGRDEPVGETIEIEDQAYIVTGVIKDIPENSHIHFDFVLSFDFISQYSGWGTSWGAFNFSTYVMMSYGSDRPGVGEKITKVAETNNCPHVLRGTTFHLQPLTEVHLDNPGFQRSFETVRTAGYVYAFTIIGFVILLIACFNFINLSTARSALRAKEVGLRKTVGARRGQLVTQFFFETIIVVGIALIVAFVIILSSRPLFQDLAGGSLSLFSGDPKIIAGYFALVALTILISGGYPSLLLSRYRPVTVLKGAIVAGGRGPLFRRLLVVFQFSLSITLLIGSAVIYSQLNYINSKDLGFDRENVIYIPIKENIGTQYQTVKERLLSLPGVTHVAAQDFLNAETANRTTAFNWEGKASDEGTDMIVSRTDYQYIETMKMELVDGRNFSQEYPTDAANAFILNEAAIKRMGIASPIGKMFSYGDKVGSIIGVVKDANVQALHEEVNPHVYHLLSDASEINQYGVVHIRYNGSTEILQDIEEVWNSVNQKTPFEYSFLSETYAKLYAGEQRIGRFLNYFTLLAFLISSLGLFGLSSFITQQRTKEVGIRKALGASAARIVGLLSREFLAWVVIANLIAGPAAWYLGNKFLETYSYRIEITAVYFVFAAVVTLLIAMLSVGYQSLKAARANPINSLRYE